MTGRVRQKRRRDAAATSEAILEAARVVFSRHGYDRVGVREIAREAGVTAALVNRYFGSKEGLFGRVLEEKIDLQPALSDRSTLGLWLARYLVTKREDRTKYDPILLMLRSAPDAEAAAVLRANLDEQLSKPLAEWLGGKSSSERAGLIMALFAGFGLMRNVIGIESLTHGDEERLIALLAPIFQSIVDAGNNHPSETGLIQ